MYEDVTRLSLALLSRNIKNDNFSKEEQNNGCKNVFNNKRNSILIFNYDNYYNCCNDDNNYYWYE